MLRGHFRHVHRAGRVQRNTTCGTALDLIRMELCEYIKSRAKDSKKYRSSGDEVFLSEILTAM
jgi:hypothetical protein